MVLLQTNYVVLSTLDNKLCRNHGEYGPMNVFQRDWKSEASCAGLYHVGFSLLFRGWFPSSSLLAQL